MICQLLICNLVTKGKKTIFWELYLQIVSMAIRKHQELDFSIRLYGYFLCESLFFAVFSHTDTYMIEQEYEASDQ